MQRPVTRNGTCEKADKRDDIGFEPDFLEALRTVLRPYVREGYPGIELVSEIASLSVRTFQRRLAEVGMSYSELVQQVRFDAARDLLLNSELSITEIAFSSGYTDHSHFTRAFRRIAGIPPRQYRATHSCRTVASH